jgi:hypothetical protein
MNGFTQFIRHLVTILTLIIVSGHISALHAAQELQTRNVILVTTDGLRIQEMFEGLDPMLLNNREKSGIDNEARLREKFWRDDPKERREALLPFFWGTLAKQGVVLGNQKLNSVVKVQNRHHFSYPGYAEILTGQPQPEVNSNDPIRIKVPTALDFARQKLNLDNKGVAAFASWNIFNYFVTHEEDSFYVNAGYKAVSEEIVTRRMRRLSRQQFQMLTPWDSVRHDVVTCELALSYLEEYKPRVLYVAPGETDDWAHNRRYDRVIEMAHYFDNFLEDLWNTLQSMDEYKDKTTLIITTDHGRGVQLDDWTGHGSKIPGADDIWVAVIGPDTPDKGELKDTPQYYQGSAASTLLTFLGLDYREYNPDIQPPIAEAIEK